MSRPESADIPPAGLSESRLRYEGWRVAAACGTGVFFTALSYFTFPIFLTPLAREFAWTRETVSAAFASMTLAAAVSAPFMGLLVDRFGARLIASVALALAGCAFASLSALTPRPAHLYAVFAVIGAASTGTSIVVFSRALSTWFDHRRGAALGAVISSSAVGGILHPPIAESAIRFAGWRGACVLLGASFIVVGLPVVAAFVRERPSASRPSAAAAVGTFLLGGADSYAAGVTAAALLGFGAGGEMDVVPYLLSRYFGLRSLSTLYGINWTAWGLAGAAGPILMGRTFDATGSCETALVALGIATMSVAGLMLTLPGYEGYIEVAGSHGPEVP